MYSKELAKKIKDVFYLLDGYAYGYYSILDMAIKANKIRPLNDEVEITSEIILDITIYGIKDILKEYDLGVSAYIQSLINNDEIDIINFGTYKDLLEHQIDNVDFFRGITIDDLLVMADDLEHAKERKFFLLNMTPYKTTYQTFCEGLYVSKTNSNEEVLKHILKGVIAKLEE